MSLLKRIKAEEPALRNRKLALVPAGKVVILRDVTDAPAPEPEPEVKAFRNRVRK